MRVRWKYPDREADTSVHMMSHDAERTLCGLAFEGSELNHHYSNEMQDLVQTKDKTTCQLCFATWKHCQSIKASEFALQWLS